MNDEQEKGSELEGLSKDGQLESGGLAMAGRRCGNGRAAVTDGFVLLLYHIADLIHTMQHRAS